MQNIDINSISGRNLRILATIYETGSISRTAELFDLNQSTVSHVLDTLRAAIGDPLFIREGRGIAPTEKAAAIMPRVQQIVASIEGLAAAEDYDPAKDMQDFAIAIPTPALLPDMRAVHVRLLENAPRALLYVKRLAQSELLPEMLSTGEADLAIALSANRYPASLRHIPYASDDLVVFYDPSSRGPIKTEEDYVNANHVVVDFGGKSTSVVEAALSKRGIRRQISLVAPTASMLGDFIRGTSLVATMPKQLSESSYRGLAYSEPPIYLAPIQYDLVWHSRFDHSGRNKWLRNVVLELKKP